MVSLRVYTQQGHLYDPVDLSVRVIILNICSTLYVYNVYPHDNLPCTCSSSFYSCHIDIFLCLYGAAVRAVSVVCPPVAVSSPLSCCMISIILNK